MKRQKVDMIQFADDIALTFLNENELQKALNVMENILNTYIMKINENKIKVKTVSGNEGMQLNFQLAGVRLKEVKEFVYLGSRIMANGSYQPEIDSRIHQEKLAFNKKCLNRKIRTRKTTSK